jgi:hypothetical protein
MNAINVLNKIMTLLSVKEEVELTYARLADGTLVESPTFDVGEALEVVAEDGTKTPAPDGFHDLKLLDEQGEELYIRVRTEDGKIVERENVEMEDVEVEPIPQANEPDEADVREDLPGSVEMEEETEEITEMPNKDEIKELYEKMAYRIDELEKNVAKLREMLLEEETEDEDEVEVEDEEEMELPKLDGAPTIEEQRFSTENKNKYGKKVVNSQSTFLSKLEQFKQI